MSENFIKDDSLKLKNSKEKWDFKQSIINGLKSGINTTWVLAKIMVPVYLIVTIVKHTFLLDAISNLFMPFMNIVGLPGEAAIVLVLGNMVNLYAALGAIATLTLTSKEITIIAVMLSFSHSLFMETAVAKKTGINVVVILLIRLCLSIVSGLLLNIFL
ncbi:nucleoside recognition domain-containing protein [Proteiniborus sp.]|uniref:nucleoside recognition domain-containing protein n=1 Tax=Proteiniborus sp. TaxID=2079015 RepID=UPI00332759F9